MRTKFSPILKLKKNILNKIEREILEVNALIAAKREEIAHLNAKIAEFSPPEANEYRAFLAYKDILHAFHKQIEAENNFLQMLESRKIDTLKRFNAAKIEHEKVNFLHTEALREILDARKRAEARYLDEIASMQFYAKEGARDD